MTRLKQFWTDMMSSFWFLPAAFVVIAVVLAVLMIKADGYWDEYLLNRLGMLLLIEAPGARDLLTTIAASMITVAGVVFSITVLVLAQASNQYTPRLLRAFMSDHGTQMVLGVFLGVFAYCSIVLHTIREASDPAFVPALAVFLSMPMAMVGVAVLIYFIHHISTSIQASHILAAIAHEAIHSVDHLFPEGVGAEEPQPIEPPEGKWWMIPSPHTGYIQRLNTHGLLEFASTSAAIVRMEHAIGEYVVQGAPITAMLNHQPTKEECRHIAEQFIIGGHRTIEQDASYGIRQIVDMALRTMSSSINDSTTALMCIDHLTAILVRLTQRRIESQYRSTDGELRPITCGPTYAGLVAEAFDEIRQNAQGKQPIIEKLMQSLGTIAGFATSPMRIHVLLEHALAVSEVARKSRMHQRDRSAMDIIVNKTIESLRRQAND